MPKYNLCICHYIHRYVYVSPLIKKFPLLQVVTPTKKRKMQKEIKEIDLDHKKNFSVMAKLLPEGQSSKLQVIL